MSGAASPMTNLCQELPEVFTPGFNQLLHQSSANAQQSPDSLLDATVRFDATVALVSTAQLANAGQVYEAQSQLLSGTSPTVASAAGLGASDASAGASLDMAVRKSDGSSSRGPSLLEVEDVEEVSPAASHQCIVQADQEPVTADDISICVEQSSTMPLNTTEDPHIDTPLAAPAAACDGLDASLRDTAAPSAQPSAAGAQPLTSLPCAAEPCEIGNAEMTAVPAERCEQHALQPDVSGGPTSTPAATSAVSEAPAAVGTGNHSETTRQSRDAPDAECDVASSEQQPVIVSSKETCIDEGEGRNLLAARDTLLRGFIGAHTQLPLLTVNGRGWWCEPHLLLRSMQLS